MAGGTTSRPVFHVELFVAPASQSNHSPGVPVAKSHSL
ncbi:Uncharacterised protein [Mycobacteroides abscessus]|nr:Uncharacterised protein [Mycobacteroides abscessus]